MDSEVKKKPGVSPMLWVGVIVVVLLSGFFAGIAYLKKSNTAQMSPSSALSPGGGPQLMGGPGPGGGSCGDGQPKSMLMINGQQVESCGMPANGQVTAISADSITVSTSAGSKTFKITAATQISKKQGAATAADITTNSTVALIPSSDDGSVAAYIILDPPQQGS